MSHPMRAYTTHSRPGENSPPGVRFLNAMSFATNWCASMGFTENAHKKLAHEAEEFAADPCLEEAADVLMCLWASARQRGWTFDDLERAVRDKMTINMSRKWTQLEDGTWRHIKEPERS